MILVGCEESQTITAEFRKQGFEAFSCDLQPTRGNPDWHIQRDIKRMLWGAIWDLVILHPMCQYLALCANKHYGKGRRKHRRRRKSIRWTLDLWDIAKRRSLRVALENPASVIFPRLRQNGAEVCFVQPYEHGHGEKKKTGFALHNLPPLKPTNPVEGREERVFKMAPSKTRSRDRSKTYPGIAKAIVDQWGPLIMEAENA